MAQEEKEGVDHPTPRKSMDEKLNSESEALEEVKTLLSTKKELFLIAFRNFPIFSCCIEKDFVSLVCTELKIFIGCSISR